MNPNDMQQINEKKYRECAQGKSTLALLLCFVLIALVPTVILSGCMTPPTKSEFYEATQAAPKDASIPMFSSRPQGSADILEGTVVLVSIYAGDKDHKWKPDATKYTENAMDIATEWMEKESKDAGHDAHIIYDEKDLKYDLVKKNIVSHSTKSERSKKFLAYYNDVEDFIKENVPVNDLKKKYKAKSIGFVVFLAGTGNSFTLPYDRNFSSDLKYYNEITSIYCYDASSPEEYENPATYAHEMLHLFGAVDLYETNKNDGITRSIVNEVSIKYPDEIMYYTYDSNNMSNFESIDKSLSPYSLYFLGWSDEKSLLKAHPEIQREYRCAF